MNPTLSEYRAFVVSHPGAYPRAYVPEERALAIWMENLGGLQGAGQLDPAVSTALDQIPGWASHDYDRRWLLRVREYEMWMSEHDGRHPRMNGVGTTPYERTLGVWATHQRRTLRAQDQGCRNPDVRAQILQERIPSLLSNGWAGWARRLGEYTAWATRNGRAPGQAAEDALEEKLAKWLSRQIDELSLDRLPADRTAALDRAVPGWSAGIDLSWDGRFDRYERFITANGGCAPRDGTGNKFEQFLFVWEQAQLSAISDGLLDANRVRLFHGLNPTRAHNAACRHKNQPRRRR